MKNKTTFIYTLSTKEEPNNIRYIGKTDNPKDRIERHTQSYYLNEGTYKSNWLKSEIKKGNTPMLNIIDEVSHDNWQFWESYWIEQFKSWGFKLTNSTTGGEGLRLTKEILDRRNKSRMHNTEIRLKEDFDNYKIKKENNIWSGERICNHCYNIVKYKKEKRAELMKIIKRAVRENRMCESCWSKNVIFCGGNSDSKGNFGFGDSNPKFNGNKGKENPFYGKIHSQKTIQLIKQKSKSKKILQLDFENNIINEFQSIRHAERETDIHRAHISKCCNNKPNHNTAGGFKWKFK